MPFIATPMGTMHARFAQGKLTSLLFCQKRDEPGITPEDSLALQMTVNFLENYFLGKQAPMPPLLLNGTPFQKSIWQILATIEYGKIASYGEIAARYCQKHNQPRLCARAAAHAVALNPVQIIIPCHRIILANGLPGNYAGGAERKKELLAHEKIHGIAR